MSLMTAPSHPLAASPYPFSHKSADALTYNPTESDFVNVLGTQESIPGIDFASL
jgi:hypothetical protein